MRTGKQPILLFVDPLHTLFLRTQKAASMTAGMMEFNWFVSRSALKETAAHGLGSTLRNRFNGFNIFKRLWARQELVVLRLKNFLYRSIGHSVSSLLVKDYHPRAAGLYNILIGSFRNSRSEGAYLFGIKTKTTPKAAPSQTCR